MKARPLLPDTADAIPVVRPSLPGLDELQPLLQRMWSSGIITTGPITRLFEEAVQRRLGVRRAVMVNHGATALMLAVRALRLKGSVIIPSFTWTATAGALIWNGLEPVFADISPGRLTLDPELAEAAITGQTSAIMPVNVFGVPPDMAAFEELCRRRGLVLITDAAQGLGARFRDRYQGAFGACECFSLSPTKVVTAVEGGLVTTNDDALADAVVSKRDSGKSADGLDIVRIGLSGRPSEFHAAVGLTNFGRLDALVAARHERMTWYRAQLEGLPGLWFQDVPADVVTTGNYFVVFIDPQQAPCSRDDVYGALKRQHIQTKKYFHPAVHLQAAYATLRKRYEGRQPVAERAAQQGLALPLYSEMTRADVERVCECLRNVFAA